MKTKPSFIAAICFAAGAATAANAPGIPHDQRVGKLYTFFSSYDCPTPYHIMDYLEAADAHDLDYRLLPAISLRESTCGIYQRWNNYWGWDSAQWRFPSVRDGIDFVTGQLADGPAYKDKTVEEKLYTYNPYPHYVHEVQRLMQQIE
jgi:hypothetical protein